MMDFSVMMDDVLVDIHGQIKKMFASTNGIPANSVAQLGRIFNDKKYREPFEGLHSEHLRSKYFEKHLGLIVSFNT